MTSLTLGFQWQEVSCGKKAKHLKKRCEVSNFCHFSERSQCTCQWRQKGKKANHLQRTIQDALCQLCFSTIFWKDIWWARGLHLFEVMCYVFYLKPKKYNVLVPGWCICSVSLPFSCAPNTFEHQPVDCSCWKQDTGCCNTLPFLLEFRSRYGLISKQI